MKRIARLLDMVGYPLYLINHKFAEPIWKAQYKMGLRARH